MTMKKDLKDYQIVDFSDQTSNIKTKKRGLRIGNYLAVAGTENKRVIYRVKQGVPLIDVYFTDLSDAIDIAEWIEDLFGDFFPIWENYPELDVFALAKWSVANGLLFYEAIQRLPEKVNKTVISKVFSEAKSHVHEWTRDIR